MRVVSILSFNSGQEHKLANISWKVELSLKANFMDDIKLISTWLFGERNTNESAGV